MALLIEDEKVSALAHDLARQRRCTVDEVIRRALERETRDLEAERAAAWRDVQEIQKRIRANWKGPITSNHDFLYDDNGDPIL